MRLLSRAKILGIALTLIVSFFVSAFYPVISTTSAKSGSDMNTVELAQSYTYLSGLSWCISNVDAPDGVGYFINGDKAANGEWFSSTGDAEVVVGYIDGNTGDDKNKLKCNELVTKAVTLWGYSSPLELLCTFYNKDNGGQRRDGTGCTEGDGDPTNDFSSLKTNSTKNVSYLRAAVINKVYGGTSPSDTQPDFNASQYELYLAAFMSEDACRAVSGLGTGQDKYNYEDVTIVGSGTKYYWKSGPNKGKEVTDSNIIANSANSLNAVTGPVKKTSDFHGADKNDELNKVGVFTSMGGNVIEKTCGEIAEQLSGFADAYVKYYTVLYPDKFSSDRARYIDCVDNPDADGCPEKTTATTSCAVDGIGWIVCPVLSFISTVTDGVYSLIVGWLKVDTSLYSQESGTYRGWQAMQSIANVGLVIVFLIIIFSQLTGMGVSNYGVKKTLPRLIIMAILINISFFVMQVAVDVSNIIGSSLNSFFSNLAVFEGKESIWSGGGDGAFQKITAFVIGGMTTGVAIGGLALAAGGVFMYGSIGLLVLVLLSAILSVLTVMAILAARQAIIVALVVLAPIALLAFLLPNTKKWYDKWQQILIAMLVLFPAVGLLFGLSQMAANVIIQGGANDGAGISVTNALLGLAVATIPLFAIIPMLKASLNAVPIAGKLAAKLSKSAALGGFIKPRMNQAKTNFGNSVRKDAFEGKYGKSGKYLAGGRARRSQKNKDFATGAAQAEATYFAKDPNASTELQAGAIGALDKIREEDIGNLVKLDTYKNVSPDDLIKRLSDPHATQNEKLAAVRSLEARGGFQKRMEMAALTGSDALQGEEGSDNAALRQAIVASTAKMGEANMPYGGGSLVAMGSGNFKPADAHVAHAKSKEFTAKSFLGMHPAAREEFLNSIRDSNDAGAKKALQLVKAQIEGDTTLSAGADKDLMDRMNTAISGVIPQSAPDTQGNFSSPATADPNIPSVSMDIDHSGSSTTNPPSPPTTP